MLVRRTALALVAVLCLAVPGHGESVHAGEPTPGVACGPGSLPEQMQGRAPRSDVATGRAAKGYHCNARVVGHLGSTGGYRVERYVDRAGHECAFYDSAPFVGEQAVDKQEDVGVYVADVSDPAKPVRTAVLQTPAMASPHESLRLNAPRGLLAAAMSSVSTGPGFVDVYDVRTDCRTPRLLSSTPLGVFGHESAFSPDGMTFYVSSLNVASLTAVDLTDPALPTVPWYYIGYNAHGMSVSNDGARLYIAEAGQFNGLTILDVTQVRDRVPAPTVPLVSRLTWPTVSIPQNATPFTRDGHRYVLEVDEFGERTTGAARIIDVQDESRPFVASDLRLEVNQPEVYDQIQDDPGNSETSRGYQAHYCTVPSRVDPNVVACSFIMSGLRVFDIRDPRKPQEIAYSNSPTQAGGNLQHLGSFAVSAPAYDHASRDIWYTDGNSGFYVVRLTGRASIPFARTVVSPGS